MKTDLVHQNLAAHQLQLQPNLDISMQGFNRGWGLQYARKMFKFFIVGNFIKVDILREYFFMKEEEKTDVSGLSIFTHPIVSTKTSLKTVTDPLTY